MTVCFRQTYSIIFCRFVINADATCKTYDLYISSENCNTQIAILFNKSKSFIQNSSLVWLFVSEGCVPLALAHTELSLSVGC